MCGPDADENTAHIATTEATAWTMGASKVEKYSIEDSHHASLSVLFTSVNPF